MFIRDTKTELRSGMVHDDGNGDGERAHLKLERRDFLKAGGIIFGAIVAALGLAVPLLMYVFMPRVEADRQHAEINQTIAVEKAVQVERTKHEAQRKTNVNSHLQRLDAIVQTTDENVRRLMWEEGVRAKPKPNIPPAPTGGTP